VGSEHSLPEPRFQRFYPHEVGRYDPRYGGDVAAQSDVHSRYPEKGLWMTECSGGTWQKGNLLAVAAQLLIESRRNWAQAVVLWSIALDEKHGPNTGGCDTCRGFVTVDRSTTPHRVIYTEDYYAIGHASRFVHPGARRIASPDFGRSGLETVSFQKQGWFDRPAGFE